MSVLRLPDAAERDRLADVAARVVRLDPGAAVRLRDAGGRVTAWATTPFGVLATCSAVGVAEPGDVVVPARDLLTALAVQRGEAVDPGTGATWRGPLPPDEGWLDVGAIGPAELTELTERALAEARDHAGPHGPPAELLDRTAHAFTGETGRPVRVPVRCLFALSGLGFAADVPVPVVATGSWVRLDTADGGVVARRVTTLPLLTT